MTKKTSNPTQSLKIPKLILQSSKLIAYFSPKLSTLYAAKGYCFVYYRNGDISIVQSLEIQERF